MPLSAFRLTIPTLFLALAATMLPAVASAQANEAAIAEFTRKRDVCIQLLRSSGSPERATSLKICSKACGTMAHRLTGGQPIEKLQPIARKCEAAIAALPAADQAAFPQAPAADLAGVVAELRGKAQSCADAVAAGGDARIRRSDPSFTKCQLACTGAADSIETSGVNVGTLPAQCREAFDAMAGKWP